MTITLTNDQAPAAPCGTEPAPTQPTTVYLSGPMTGYQDWNYPAFEAAAARLRTLGWVVLNPAESKLPPDTTPRAAFLADDLMAITVGAGGEPVDGIVFLDGWTKSAGARMEALVGLEMGMRFYLYEPDLRDGVFPIAAGEVRWRIATAMASLLVKEEAIEALSAPKANGGSSSLPLDSASRKGMPMATGCLDYFPNAWARVSQLSKFGNDKHNPGEPLHHARGKSMDHADCIVRHLVDRGKIDPETGMSHTVEVAWRALALLQEEEEAAGAPLARGARLGTAVPKAA